MKTLKIHGFGLGVALFVSPFLMACSPQAQSDPADTSKVSAPAPSVQLPADALTAPSAQTPPPPAEKKIPANINPSPALAEVIKLARAGVEGGVLVAYVNSAQSAFNLDSDEIIFLTDIGVPDEVMTAMMDRDAVLKQPWAPPTQVASAAAGQQAPAEAQPTAGPVADKPVAVGPTYMEPQQSQSEPVIVNNNYFYETLAPYGSWVSLPNYGWCWQPTVAVINNGWRPYCDRGRWLNTSAGWYWQSDYSWGQTFQYGRWFNQPGRGWCWWPDRVWGPSWVTWRYNSGYCGWAPLPPATYCNTGIGLSYVSGSVGVSFGFGLSSDCYTFVGWNNFCDPKPYRYCAPKSQTKYIFESSTVVNNYVVGNNNTVINHGVAPEQVRHYSGRNVPVTNINEARSRRGADRMADGGENTRRASGDRRGRDTVNGEFQAAANRSSLGRPSSAGLMTDRRDPPALRSAVSASTLPPRNQIVDGGNDAFRTTPPEQRDRRDDRINTGPRPGTPENQNRRAPLILKGADTSARAQAATPETAPVGSLILKGYQPSDAQAEPRAQSGRYVPPTQGRNDATGKPRNSAVAGNDARQTVTRTVQSPATLPQRATAWSQPVAQRTESQPVATDSYQTPAQARTPIQASPTRGSVFSSPQESRTPAVSQRSSTHVIRSAPTPVERRVSTPATAMSAPSSTRVAQSTPRIEPRAATSRPSSSARIESSSPRSQSSGESRPVSSLRSNSSSSPAVRYR